jgi:(p)ppGpp synthase/HD superfamily hydrolase|mmetsp:Transcript_27900/g.42734  ORF Transcript_27900/g.42734 Transcript_27900/m.42734 type:complete len:682 (+) Transcript_27900:200-2245(+)|eukprot:CAMPEP_0195289850 /NCGR_PEP_ID=MMETSP0707-20130614/5957_1 /TAXON_ID=33640 /ORGANISM="Asterionellopsis glacialis, Strain CCMP134" /LENGTH=681 /DNA_ID=CAMNT_0040349901 /DNA_START=147 /DNA_END=2192 /DNA_ORIENTATION=-
MTCELSNMRHRRRPRQDRRKIWLASAFTVASFATDASAFTITKPRVPSTQRFFQVTGDIPEHDVASTIISQALVNQPSSSQSLSHEHFPTWLRVPRGPNYAENMATLRFAMNNSFFSENQVFKIIHAIEVASGGDKNQMAGAAEFLLILVETMEMGANALVAAAFHYCSCVNALEFKANFPTESFWDNHQHPEAISSFGDHAFSIAQDAARLKKIETVAASVMKNTHSSRASPDSRDAENLRKLLLTETRDWRALAIRSAASLYRLRGIIHSGNTKLNKSTIRVCREALHIYAPLASQLGMQRLKNELEGSAFKILYSRQYKAVKSLGDRPRKFSAGPQSIDIGQSMKNVLEGVTEEIREMLANDQSFSKYAENVAVTARVKEPYSMWQKMLRNKAKHILEIPDALALRIVFDAKKSTPDEDSSVTQARERALCYYAQKLCMERWRPAEEPRFKDYIDRPKPNGYQSLHYTASTEWGGEDWSLEIQVRSGEMHKVAEYGLASHWDYKANSKQKNVHQETAEVSRSSSVSHEAYLKSLQEWHWQHQSNTMWSDATPASHDEWLVNEDESNVRADRIRARTAKLAPYIEAFAETQSYLLRDHVFVFLSSGRGDDTSEGKVMALPAGACVLDALRDAEREHGLKVNMRSDGGVVHNGEAANVNRKLQNGDVLIVKDDEMVGTLM